MGRIMLFSGLIILGIYFFGGFLKNGRHVVRFMIMFLLKFCALVKVETNYD